MTYLRTCLAIALGFVECNVLLAQTPDSIAFQGFIDHVQLGAVDSNDVSVTFRFFKHDQEIWSESQSVDVVDGVFSVALGSVTPIDSIRFDAPIDLEMELDGEGVPLSPRTPLTSAAFALGLRGMTAAWVESGVSSGYTLVGGHPANSASANTVGATIGGGGGDAGAGVRPNTVTGNFGTVSGGIWNISGVVGTVGGGQRNLATGITSTIGGGNFNSASGSNSSVGGGTNNSATAESAAVGGGNSNEANGQYSTVSGGNDSEAGSDYAAVGGGSQNIADGVYSTVPGGRLNEATGDYSFAAGYRAHASHTASFVWSDSSGASFSSTGLNQFLIRASGGVGIGTSSPVGSLSLMVPADDTTGPLLALLANNVDSETEAGRIRFIEGDGSDFAGPYLHNNRKANRFDLGFHNTLDKDPTNDTPVISFAIPSGFVGLSRPLMNYPLQVGSDGTDGNGAHVTIGGMWQNGSSREFKENFDQIDGREILDRLSTLTITRWQYRGGEKAEHIGPVAEEFNEAFGVGADDQYIGTGDADGVALAAIQELYSVVLEQQAEIKALRAAVAGLEGRK